MFFHNDIKGNRLPPGTVCLTYDDGPGATEGEGPGPRTLELGRYLAAEGVAATFFVIGLHAERHYETLDALRRWGHLIGNHTYSHPGLVAFAARGGDVEGEIARTDALIRPHVREPVTFFRAPYGNWRETVDPEGKVDKDTSVIAERLNRGGAFPGYVGPVNWDVEDADWEHWRLGHPAEDCARGYLAAVERAGRGIILMHDSSEEPEVRPRNRALQATQLLVPALRARGYRFVRLDAIPQVASAARVAFQVALRAENERYVALTDPGRDELAAVGLAPGEREAFGVVPLGDRRVALRASHGLYVSPSRAGGGEVVADAPAVGTSEPLEWQDVGECRVALRAVTGHYLHPDARDGDRLRARARTPGEGATFEVVRLFGGTSGDFTPPPPGP